jgi:uncharacterized protein YecT (DUF1311 family)
MYTAFQHSHIESQRQKNFTFGHSFTAIYSLHFSFYLALSFCHENNFMKKILLSTLIATLSFPMLSCAASFDCTKASSTTEKLICNNEFISKLDEQLASSYKQAMEKSIDKDVLKKSQAAWLKQQRACKDAACLEIAYQARINDLNNNGVEKNRSSSAINTTPTTKSSDTFRKPLTFKLAFGDSYPVCQPYVNMLNEAKYDSNPVCERKILPEFPQFKALQWTEINDKQGVETIMEENVRMNYAFLNKLDSQQQKNEIQDLKDIIASGEFKFCTDPHFTVARQMTPAQLQRAVLEWQQRQFKASFKVSEMVLLRRSLIKGSKCQEIVRIPLMGLPGKTFVQGSLF